MAYAQKKSAQAMLERQNEHEGGEVRFLLVLRVARCTK